MDSEWHVSALTARSLTWDRSAFTKAPTRHPRRRFENEAVAWQLASQRGGWAAFRSYVDQSADRRARRKDPNRIVELHAMIGAIGEQAGLCWGFEQDAQRFDATRKKIAEEHHRLVLRALSRGRRAFPARRRAQSGQPRLADCLARSAGRPGDSGGQAEGGLRSWIGRQEGMAVAQRVERDSGQGRERRLPTYPWRGSRPRSRGWQSTRATSPSTPGGAWTTTGSARSLSRTPPQSAASHRQATAFSRSISLVPCSIPKLMQTGSTNCSSRPWRRSGRPW